MRAMPTANRDEAASKGATGPRDKLDTRKLATSPAKMATSPFPRKIALEKVRESHCASKPL